MIRPEYLTCLLLVASSIIPLPPPGGLLSEEFQHNFYPHQLCNNAHRQVWQYAIHTTHGMPLAPPRCSCHLRSNSYVTFCSGNALIVADCFADFQIFLKVCRKPPFLHSLLFLQREQYNRTGVLYAFASIWE